MTTMNHIAIIGNLTKDPDTRTTPAGKSVTDLRLASNRKYKTANGDTREETCFVTVTAWGSLSDVASKFLRKGAPVLIEGRLHYTEWEQEGTKHNRITIVAERLQFLPKPTKADSSPTPTSSPETQANANRDDGACEPSDDVLPF